MEWLAQNWLWVLIGILFVVMHLFGHGGHGGHGGHSSHSEGDAPDKPSPKKSSGHQH